MRVGQEVMFGGKRYTLLVKCSACTNYYDRPFWDIGREEDFKYCIDSANLTLYQPTPFQVALDTYITKELK